jgi:hypothetical protein
MRAVSPRISFNFAVMERHRVLRADARREACKSKPALLISSNNRAFLGPTIVRALFYRLS